MTHVVTANCEACRYTECVAVCPVACFHGDEERLYIDPDACVDCSACIPACPVGAIKEDFDLTPEEEEWTEINAARARGLPIVRAKQAPLATAEARRSALGFH
jgi:ferredoxin